MTSRQDGTPFYPENEEERETFERNWCAHCLLGKPASWEDEFGNEVAGECRIASAAMVYPVKEWTIRHGMPWCLAFEQDHDNQARCLFTEELPL